MPSCLYLSMGAQLNFSPDKDACSAKGLDPFAFPAGLRVFNRLAFICAHDRWALHYRFVTCDIYHRKNACLILKFPNRPN
jgi:hypothetical protein